MRLDSLKQSASARKHTSHPPWPSPTCHRTMNCRAACRPSGFWGRGREWGRCGLPFSCGRQIQLLRGIWDLSSPARIEPTSPALEDGFLTTGPPVSPSMSSPLDYVTAHSYLQSNVIFSLRVFSSTFRKRHPHLHSPLLSCHHLTVHISFAYFITCLSHALPALKCRFHTSGNFQLFESPLYSQGPEAYIMPGA